MKEIKTIILNEEEGEIICPKCKGNCIIFTGKLSVSDFDKVPIEDTVICPKCFGTGKLDWIENILGKRSRGNLLDDAITTASKKLKDRIDKDILNNIVNEAMK